MQSHEKKTQEKAGRSDPKVASQKKDNRISTFPTAEHRPEAISQRKLQAMADNSPGVLKLKAFQEMANNSPGARGFNALQTQGRGRDAGGPDSSPIQRQVIQLFNADERLEEGKLAREAALIALGGKNYPEVIIKYKELKEIAGELFHRNVLGKGSKNEEKVFSRHIHGNEKVIGISQHIREVIEAIKTQAQSDLDTYVLSLQSTNDKAKTLYVNSYEKMLAEVAGGNNQSAIGAQSGFKKLVSGYPKAFQEKVKLVLPLLELKENISQDTEQSYVKQESNREKGGNKDEEITQIPNSKLLDLDFSNYEKVIIENKSFEKIFGAKKEGLKDYPIREEEQISGELKGKALKELAGKKFEKINELFPDDIPTQLLIINQLNKTHRNEIVGSFEALINTVGKENLNLALSLIDLVGKTAKIAEMNTFLEKTANVKGNPILQTKIDFLNGLPYTSLIALADFVEALGAKHELAVLKGIWPAVEENKNSAPVIEFLNGENIPEDLEESRREIGLAFAQKKGQSTAADWKKLLSIPDWEGTNKLGLALAFDKNPGGADADKWLSTAQGDKKLETSPHLIPGTIKLNSYANDSWYDDFDTEKLGSAKKAQKKYTQLLYALLGNQDLSGLGGITFNNIKGDFLSMLVFFHRHIASFDAEKGHGFDREKQGGGVYSRSNKNHPLNEQYKQTLKSEGVIVKDLLQPLNSKLLKLQGGANNISKAKKGKATYRNVTNGKFSVASAGLPSHNLKILEDQQEVIGTSIKKPEALKKLFQAPQHDLAPEKSRSLDASSEITNELVEKQKEALKGKVAKHGDFTNFHDGMLGDRGSLVSDISDIINSISGGNKVMKAIGSEGHPSLILLVPKNINKCRYNNTDYDDTHALVPQIVTDFNGAGGQDIKITQRGSFGFQRPTVSDTGDSIRIWPGYAPVEALLPGLKAVVSKLNNKKQNVDLTNFDQLDGLKTDNKKPILYIEGLKTAMRHAFVVLKDKIDKGASPEKKRVYEWIRTRMLIKLQQAGILLNKGETLYAENSIATQSDKNKHFQITADMTDKLQEYAMLISAATLGDTANPNADTTQTGKFRDDSDVYEQKVIAGKLGAANYKVFYLDSGEQALVSAGILANRFQKEMDETDSVPVKSKYISKNPYFEMGFGGAARSNLELDNNHGTIVHADMSPVITGGRTDQKPKAEVTEEVRKTWQNQKGEVTKDNVIPIIDITNSGIESVTGLGAMPNNYIIVESLTKHQQLGADKFIMGRMVVVSKTAGTSGNNALDRTNFLDLAQKIVGPVANEAYNPLLSKIRANMDKVLYSDDIE